MLGTQELEILARMESSRQLKGSQALTSLGERPSIFVTKARDLPSLFGSLHERTKSKFATLADPSIGTATVYQCDDIRSPRGSGSPTSSPGLENLVPLELSKIVEINPDVIGRPERRAKVRLLEVFFLSAFPNTRQIYSLDAGAKWVDRGTGFVDVVIAEGSTASVEDGWPAAWIVVTGPAL